MPSVRRKNVGEFVMEDVIIGRYPVSIVSLRGWSC